MSNFRTILQDRPMPLDPNGDLNNNIHRSRENFEILWDRVSELNRNLLDINNVLDNLPSCDCEPQEIPVEALNPNEAVFSNSFGKVFTPGDIYYVNATFTLEDAITRIGSDNATIVINNTQTLTGDLTTPTNVVLRVMQTGQIGGTFTLTINGNFEAGLYQVFGSDITVVLGDLAKSKIHPEWWGVDGIADEVEINKAIIAGGNNSVIDFGAAYVCAAPIVLGALKHVILEGNKTQITSSSTTSIITLGDVTDAVSTEWNIIRDFSLTTQNADSGKAKVGIWVTGSSTAMNKVENMRIYSPDAAGGSTTEQANNMGILFGPSGLGCYFNTFSNIQTVNWDVGCSFGYDFDAGTWSAQEANREYFYSFQPNVFGQYGVYFGRTVGSQFYSTDFTNSGSKTGAISAYFSWNGSKTSGNILYGDSENASTVDIEIEDGSNRNIINVQTHGGTITDNNTTEQNFIYSERELSLRDLGVRTISNKINSVVQHAISGTGTIFRTAASGILLDIGDITVNDGAWVGLGAAAGRLEFVNDTIDEANFLGCKVGINKTDPESYLTIEQSTDDDNILQLQSSTDVSQPVTSLGDANTYLAIRKSNAIIGGTRFLGFTDAATGDGALYMHGLMGAANASNNAVRIMGGETDGATGTQNMTAGNILSVQKNDGAEVGSVDYAGYASFEFNELVIDQLQADTNILELRSTGDVAHNVTDLANTAAYFAVEKNSGGKGGAHLMGFLDTSGGDAAINLHGIMGAQAGGNPGVRIKGSLKSGTGTTNMTIGYILAVQKDDNTNVAFIEYDGDMSLVGDLSLTGSNKELRFYEGANYVGFEAPALSADQIWVLPAVDGNSNESIITDGSANLSFGAGGGGFYNGTFKETFDALVTSDGATITMSLEQSGTGDLTMQFSDGETTLDCTPACTITLTAGTDASPQANYIYIPQSTKVLTKSTSQWPSTEHIKIAYFFVPSAAYVQSDGCYVNQNWNDHLTGTNNQGHLTHITERLRYDGANYFSGIDPNGTDQAAASSYFDDDAGAAAYWKSTSGVIYQMHNHAMIAIDTSSGDDIHVVNWNGDAYHDITDLFDIVADSTGGSLSNKYFNVFFFAVGNKTGEYTPLMAQLPNGSYSTQTSAENDVDGYDVLSMPRQFAIDSSTGVPICRMTLRWTGGLGTLTHISTKDLRGQNLTGGGSGAGGGSTQFADNQFTIFNVTDNTKILDFDISAVTIATTRTITMADRDLDLAAPVFDSATIDTMSLATGSITDSTGAISFGNENLSTTGTLSAGVTTVTRLQIDDANSYIDEDGSSNMTFTDAVTGTKTLAELAAGGGSVSFGAENQIPTVNAATDDFDYSANLTFDGTNFGIGITPDAPLRVDGNVAFGPTGSDTDWQLNLTNGGTNTRAQFKMTTYNDQSNYPSIFLMQKSHTDTIGSQVATIDGEILFYYNIKGCNSSNTFQQGAALSCTQDGAASTRVPAMWEFLTSNGSSNASTALKVRADKSIELPNDNAYLKVGAASDAGFTYDGANMVFDSQLVGAGHFSFVNGDFLIGTGTATLYRVTINSGTANLNTVLVSTDAKCFLGMEDNATTIGYVKFGAVGNDLEVYSGDASTPTIIFQSDHSINQGWNSVNFTQGGGNNAGMQYNGTNWIFNPKIVGTGVMLADTDSKWCWRATSNYIYSSAANTLDISAGTTINILQDTFIAAAKDLDCYTNGGYFKPRRVSQSTIPTPDANELMVWRDSDDSKTYLVYNDASEGIRSVEMI